MSSSKVILGIIRKRWAFSLPVYHPSEWWDWSWWWDWGGCSP